MPIDRVDFITNYTYLKNAALIKSNLQSANLQNAVLENANLTEANIKDTNLEKADLKNAILRGANLENAFLKDVRNINFSQIKEACFWDRAVYEGEWNKEKRLSIAIEPDNSNFIEKLKKDTASEPEDPPNCSDWKNANEFN